MTTISRNGGSGSQRLVALGQANDLRSGRKRAKASILAEGPRGGVLVAELLLGEAPLVASLDVGDLLQWVPGVGRKQAKCALRLAGSGGVPLSPWTRCRSLTPRQRSAVAGWLVAHAAGVAR